MILREYTVECENNTPVVAVPINENNRIDIIKCTVQSGKKIIKWLAVFAYDEKDAIDNASEMMNNYLKPNLGLSC